MTALRRTTKGLRVGDDLEVRFPGGRATLPVGGIYEPNGALGQYAVSSTPGRPSAGTSATRPSTSPERRPEPEAAEQPPDATLAVYPNLDLLDEAVQGGAALPGDQLLFLIYALLGLAILIAVLGIVNTLALSVVERTREIGLLRAVGLSRRQLRRMVRLESVAISVSARSWASGRPPVRGALQRSAEPGVHRALDPGESLSSSWRSVAWSACWRPSGRPPGRPAGRPAGDHDGVAERPVAALPASHPRAVGRGLEGF